MEVIAKRSGGKRVEAGGLLGLSIQVDTDGLELAIGPVSLCDAVSMAVLMHTSGAIAKGLQPQGGAQRPLDPQGEQGRNAKHGRRPNVRGNPGKPKSLPYALTRSAIRSSGQVVRIGGGQLGYSAHATIEAGMHLQERFLLTEASRGVEYLSIVGKVDQVVTDVVTDYLATVLDGPRTYSDGKQIAGAG